MQDINEFINIVNKTGKVSIQEAHEQTDKLLNDFDDEGENNMRIKAYELLDIVLAAKQSGDADDYYSYAVLFARINDYDAACDILERGLLRNPQNVDLLATYIVYAPDNSDEFRYEKCQKYFSKLQNIPREKWTWRAYDFSIEYLCKLAEQDDQDMYAVKEKTYKLVSQYLEAFPLDERAHYAKYNCLFSFGESLDKQIETLEVALKDTFRAARCAMRLADLKFERKDYENTIELLNKTSQDAIDLKIGISMANVYLLRFVARAAQLLEKSDGGKNLNKQSNKEIKEAYIDYNLARKLKATQSKIKLAGSYVKILEEYSGIENPEEYDD
ncbi:MAG: hypothetical protein FWC80_04880 [Firmicutes bacterium]|nr:hypothetical protein [Bacillota bacterium]